MSTEDKVNFLLADNKRLELKLERLEKNQAPKQWLSLKEVKEEYGYAAGTIYQMNHKRQITTRHAGGLQVKRSSLEKLLKPKISWSAEEMALNA